MDRRLAKTRLARLALVFAISWTVVLGYQVYNAYAAQDQALQNVRMAGAGSAIMRASVEASGTAPDAAQNALIDSTTGADHFDDLQATYRSARDEFSKSLWLLFGGLAGGLAFVTAFYWAMYGATKADQNTPTL